MSDINDIPLRIPPNSVKFMDQVRANIRDSRDGISIKNKKFDKLVSSRFRSVLLMGLPTNNP